ncbi:alpha/beta fold hydrolase [Arenimonas sp.]|uniref:alpha/beta fold hydrolase n=1 Tax=Arenimonas sp. TaxID=1872635 RepID=UPI0039E28AAA
MSEDPSPRLTRGELFPLSARHACFIHGGGGGAWEWNIWARVFAARDWRVATPELQPSPHGLAATRLHDYIAQSRARIETLPSPRIVVGASLGGLLALANAPLADALVLINPLPSRPWCADLPRFIIYADIVPWSATASLAGTRRALFDADEATCLYAFRRWRDESATVLREAHDGISLPSPTCPVLMIVSGQDDDIPEAVSLAFAEALNASVLRLPEASHVGPLLGRRAARTASEAVDWLNGIQKGG